MAALPATWDACRSVHPNSAVPAFGWHGEKRALQLRRVTDLQARVDVEGAGGGVHARDVLRAANVLLRQLLAVVPVAVAQVLPHQRDGLQLARGGWVSGTEEQNSEDSRAGHVLWKCV